MKTRKTRLLCLILCLAMCLALLPTVALAQGEEFSSVSFSEATGALSWSAVADASSYAVQIYRYNEITDTYDWGFNAYMEQTSCNVKTELAQRGFPAGTYRIVLYAMNADQKQLGSGYYVTAVSVTEKGWTYTPGYTALSAPTNLSFSDGTFTWNSVSGAAGYMVTVEEQNYGRVAIYDNVSSNSLTLTGTDLVNGYSYRIHVCALGNELNSTAGSPVATSSYYTWREIKGSVSVEASSTTYDVGTLLLADTSDITAPGSSSSLSYQWQYSYSSNGPWIDISANSTSKSFTLPESQEGHYIRVKVTATGYFSALYSPAIYENKTLFPVTVDNGMAYDKNLYLIYSAAQYDNIRLRADSAPSGQVFDHWNITNGDDVYCLYEADTVLSLQQRAELTAEAVYKSLSSCGDGLNKIGKTWYYIKNHAVQTSYTGLVYYSGTWYYVQNGVLNWGVTTLTQYNGTWYYVSNSQVNWKYTGLTQYYSTTYYIQGGVLKWGVNGLTNCGGTWAYLKNSAVDTSVTTLVQYNGTWYYVQKGILNWGVTTLVQFNGTWYYVQNSTLKWGVNTLVQYQRNWFYVRNSAVDWSFTGIVPYNGNRFYVQGGMIKWGYNGVVPQDGKFYTVENSVVTKISNTAPPSGRNTL